MIHINTSKKVYEIIINIYSKLKLKKSKIILNTMIFFHKYYLFNLINNTLPTDFSSKDFILLCASCFLIGAKASDVLIRVDDIIKRTYSDTILSNDNDSFEYQKQTMIDYEYEILESIGFDINTFEFNYKYVSDIFDQINKLITIEADEAKAKTIKEFLLARIRYSFIFPLFLKFNIFTIVLSNINISFKQLINNYGIEKIINNLSEYHSGVIRDYVDDCTSLIEIYLEKKKDNTINNINNNIEEDGNKKINMNIIRKINLSSENNTNQSDFLIDLKDNNNNNDNK